MAGLGNQMRGNGLAKVQRQNFRDGGEGRTYIPIDNKEILEKLYEDFLDKGYPPEQAEKLAKKEFEKRAK